MATTAQIAANHSNAAKSTGPLTKSGKARSSRNALRHGLTAEQVVISGEDPAAFEALRDDLYAHYQPADPVAEHLVEQVTTCIWRLRRVPEIEAGIYSHFYFERERGLAIDRRSAEEYHFDPPSCPGILDEEAHAAAKKDQERAGAKLEGDQPTMGAVFRDSERSLTSLVRIAGAIEGSMYRAIHELERRKAEREDLLEDFPDECTVIDAEVDEEDWVE